YHETWKNNNLDLNKAILIRNFKRQLELIKKHGTEEEKDNATRLENQFKVSIVQELSDHSSTNHIQWLPMELHLRMVMDR
ncbi:29908_t:CDS:1, partial [Racocetra persica]